MPSRLELSFSSYKTVLNMDVDVGVLLPSDEDHMKLLNRMAVIVSRILVEHMPAFKLYFEDVVEYHLKHDYSFEMSKKSEVVIKYLSQYVHVLVPIGISRNPFAFRKEI